MLTISEKVECLNIEFYSKQRDNEEFPGRGRRTVGQDLILFVIAADPDQQGRTIWKTVNYNSH